MDLWFAKSVQQNAESPFNSDKVLDVKQDILSESAIQVLWGSYWLLQTRQWQFAQLLWVTNAHSKMSRDMWSEQAAQESSWR